MLCSLVHGGRNGHFDGFAEITVAGIGKLQIFCSNHVVCQGCWQCSADSAWEHDCVLWIHEVLLGRVLITLRGGGGGKNPQPVVIFLANACFCYSSTSNFEFLNSDSALPACWHELCSQSFQAGAVFTCLFIWHQWGSNVDWRSKHKQ